MNGPKRRKCCRVSNFCGKELVDGVFYVSIIAIVISAGTLIGSVAVLHIHASKDSSQILRDSLVAADMVISMVGISMSLYQMLISGILLWQVKRRKGSVFLTSLWITSHFAIVTLYGFIIFLRTFLSFHNFLYLHGSLTIVFGGLYESVFIYFIIVTNSHLTNIDEDVCYSY